MTKLLTPTDIANASGFHRDSVLRFIKTGRLPAHKVEGQWRVKESDFKVWAGVSENAEFADRANSPDTETSRTLPSGRTTSLRLLRSESKKESAA